MIFTIAAIDQVGADGTWEVGKSFLSSFTNKSICSCICLVEQFLTVWISFDKKQSTWDTKLEMERLVYTIVPVEKSNLLKINYRGNNHFIQQHCMALWCKSITCSEFSCSDNFVLSAPAKLNFSEVFFEFFSWVNNFDSVKTILAWYVFVVV